MVFDVLELFIYFFEVVIKYTGEQQARYDRRRRIQQRDEMAIRLHANNQQHWSPSLLARSVAYYGKLLALPSRMRVISAGLHQNQRCCASC